MKSQQLPITGKRLQRCALEHRGVVADVVEHCGFEYKESAADPTLSHLGLLGEGRHEIILDIEIAEACGRANGSNGSHAAVRAVKSEQCADIHIRYSIAVGEHEGTCLLY